MHPPHYGYYHYHRRFRPSRLLWFAVGGLAATWYWKAKECRDAEQGGRFSRFYGNCWRPPVTGFHENRDSLVQRVNDIPIPPSVQAHPDALPPASAHAAGQAPPSGWEPWQSQKQWDEDKARFAAMTQQATDAMTDISEATLDNILSTVEHLKAKLAQQKAIRELHRKELAAMTEQEQQKEKESARWV